MSRCEGGVDFVKLIVYKGNKDRIVFVSFVRKYIFLVKFIRNMGYIENIEI